MIRRIVSGLALACALIAPALSSAEVMSNDPVPPGGKYHVCSGSIVHVSSLNLRVHCNEGNPIDLSFFSWPKVGKLATGKAAHSDVLAPGTPVFVVFTQSLGIRHATAVTVYDQQSGQVKATLTQ